ncbi:TetR/AcrR family transcriptional regulator [Pseudonocardia eucalypti]|uniref:TetR/AcrR family transcriptional regulator n=2 Tax=Pseudonocardia eucalypti TaxID=648755 RepID=A0ABP9PQM2_9PSEU|nr:AcrR family transcriptional regulator [Pseudonocardia eucalypti]
MVRAILDAARTVLENDGYSAASTNKIARAARISPGSLYQYFPDKDAIVAAVVQEYTDQLVARVTGHLLSKIGTCGERELIRESLQVTLDALEEQPELVRAISENTPRLGVSQKIAAVEERIGELVLAHLRLRSQPVPRSSVRVWMSVRVVEHLTMRYVLDRPPIERDVFLDEVTDLIVRYAYT